MAQVKIYGLKSNLEKNRESLSLAIHDAVMSALEYPREKKIHRFLSLDEKNFIFPEDRSNKYTIIEISMFEGRSVEAKKALIKALFSNIESRCGILPQDIEITLYETPKHNWGIRGLPGDELNLGYKVGV